jgi:exopolysaccharide production protein ExoQ
MPPIVASFICICVIAYLLFLERDGKSSSSWALWLPTAWLLISGSRPVSAWLNVAPVGSPDQYLEGSPIDRMVYSALVLAGIVVLVGRRPAVTRILRMNWPILLYVLYCAISIIWSDHPDVAFKRWIKSWGDYVMVLIMLTDRDRLQAIKQVFARVGIVLLSLSILFIKYYPDLGRAYASHWEGTVFFVGVASDKNMLGMCCMVFGFAAFWRVLMAWSGPRAKWGKLLFVHGILFAFAFWLLLKSNSMTSLACFILVSALVAANTFLRFARKKSFVNVGVAAIVFLCASVLFLNMGGGLLQSLGRNSTLTGRTDIWDAVLQVPINPLLGAGFESFWMGERLKELWTIPIMNGINEAHNGYLETYLNLGWVGVTLFGLLILTGYRNILRMLRRDPEGARIRLGFFVIAVVYNFTEAGTRSTDLVWIAFLFAVIGVPELVARKRVSTRISHASVTNEKFQRTTEILPAI